DGFFEIADEILARGLGFGVSTNATVLSDRVLDRLRQLRIGAVQVSLDGATAATHELIRGAPGSFTRTLVGISRISQFADPVINTVVNRINLDDLEEIVRIGIEHGCRRFKVRYRLASLLAVAVCAVLAGASTFAAIADWAADLDPPARRRWGCWVGYRPVVRCGGS